MIPDISPGTAKSVHVWGHVSDSQQLKTSTVRRLHCVRAFGFEFVSNLHKLRTMLLTGKHDTSLLLQMNNLLPLCYSLKKFIEEQLLQDLKMQLQLLLMSACVERQ